jgi:serine/threonine protein kinase
VTTDPFGGVPRKLKGGRYELIESIGSGGAGEVWRARDTTTGSDCAVKVLDPARGTAKDLASRFVAEAKVMHELRNPRIVRVHGLGKDEGWYWFAMDLLPGGTLKSLIDQGAVPVEQALKLTFQTLQALAAVHRHGVVHRDVKPHNVLIDEAGDAVLADFGLARHRPGEARHTTHTGDFFGSFGYIAPEQRKDPRHATAQSDLYSVGATLYHMITARRPADLALLDADPKSLAPLDPAILGIIKRSCAYKPEARYPDARAMAEGIAAARDAIVGGEPQAAAWMAEFDAALAAPPVVARKGCLWFLG